MAQNLRPLVVAATAVVVALALGGCVTQSSSNSSSSSGAKTDTIRTTLTTDPTGFDPARATAGDDYEIDRFLYDTVVRLDDDNKLIGGLASSWKATPTSATLTIRDGATCADGTPIDAKVVADSLSYFADPATKSNFTRLVFGPGQATITASGDKTVKIQLAQPWSDLMVGLTIAQSGIICPAGLADKAGLLAGSVKGAFSGPYTLTKSQHGVSYTLALRSGYDAWPKWADEPKGTPAKTVVFSPGVAPQTVTNEAVTGQLDIASIQAADLKRIKAQKGYQALVVPWAGLSVMFNERPGNMFADDKELRTAVAQTIDRDAFNSAVAAGQGVPYKTLVAPTVPYAYDGSSLFVKKNTAAAAKVLKGKTIRIISSTSIGPNGAAGVYLQNVLKAAGADAQLTNVDNGTWATTINSKPTAWDITIMGDINAVGTVTASLTRFAGTPSSDQGGRNISGGANDEAYQDTLKAQASTDDATRKKLYAAAQKALLEDVDYVPLMALPNVLAERPGFSVEAKSGVVDWGTMRITG